MKANARILVILAGMFLLVGVGVGASLRAFGQIRQTGAVRQLAHEELTATFRFLSALEDAETGYRGYLLTRDPAFLQPYLRVRDSLLPELKALRQPGLSEAALRHLDRIAPLMATDLASMEHNLKQSGQPGLTSAAMGLEIGQGKAWMDQLRTELAGFIQLEQTELARSEASFQDKLRSMLQVICATSVLTLALALLFAYLFYQEAQQRIRDLVLIETRRLLDVQETLNLQLQEANETLQESEEKLTITFNAIGDAVLTTDAAGHMTGLNAVAERLTGWTQAEAAGRPVDEVFRIINQETRLPVVIPIRASLESGTIHGLANHTVLLARGGEEFAIADSCAPIRSRDGHVIGAVMVFRDVTEDYAVQKALREYQEKLRWTEESFRLMVESVVDCAIVMLDPQGLVISWNTGAQRIKGYSAEEILGQPFSRFYPPADADGPRGALETATATGRYEHQGWRMRKDGSVFWASVILTAIRDQDGVLRGFAKLTQDLTERRMVERELQEARELAENANQAKSNFLSSMSHELRSPLNAILGFAQLLDSAMPPPAPTQKASLDQILKAGWHLLTLINEILDLAKVESGQVPLSREPVGLGELLAECRLMVDTQAAPRGIRLIFPPATLPRYVLADRTRVKQVLLNLLSNAVKYNAREGTVEVRCFESRTGVVRVAIRDLGPGLRPEQLTQLFQPFNRLGQEAGAEEGTGIGLVVAKRLVELMDGVIGVESTVGVGSEFWFELPSVAAPRLALEEPEAVPLQAVDAQQPVSTVLYVEDNPANLKLVEQILLRHPDMRLLTAVNGALGLDLARTAQPSVILMDINLPGMSGFEVMEQLRADPATAHIPVIALSANAMPSDLARGRQAGFRSYITKPIVVKNFMAALRGALRS